MSNHVPITKIKKIATNKFKRVFRILIVSVFYALISYCGFFSAYYVRFDGEIPSNYLAQFNCLASLLVGVQVASLIMSRQCSVVIYYFSLVDLRLILLANGISCLFLFLIADWGGVRIPRGVMFLDFLFLTGGIGAARIALRYWSELRRLTTTRDVGCLIKSRPVVIVGAGDAGARLVRDLLSKPTLRWKPIAFFDDDPSKWGQWIHGIPIIGKPELIRDVRWRELVRKIIVAAPSASPIRIGEIARMAADLGIASDTLPAIDQLVDGKVKISQLRPVRIDDLLRRPTVPLDQAAIQVGLQGKAIAVTGAGGSIGSEICRQILRARPRQLLLIERSEVQLFQIEQELLEIGGAATVVPLIADITDSTRIREIFNKYRPDAIYHAAAHKHVPMMEVQPAEAIRNNSLGTANMINLSHEFGIARFVLISTDKAINPTNVMGASKRLAEVYLQAFQAANPMPTRFMAVRFGNVLGSSGSVVPTFQKQIAAGGPVTVTHPEVTRYFMTIPEAVGLVLQAGAFGQGGEIFTLDMGGPVKVVELARQMIELSGYRPEEEIEIRFVGLRPGEKMYEEISHVKEHLSNTEHPKIFRFVSTPIAFSVIEKQLNDLRLQLGTAGPMDLKCWIKTIIPEYKPFVE